MLAAYHSNLSHKIIGAKNTLAKLSNNMKVKVTSGNSVKWIIVWALEQMKPDVLWICIQRFDRIGFIKVLVFPVRIFLSFFCCAEPTVPSNDLFCSLSFGEDYAVSFLYPASVIKHLAVYHWFYLCIWDKLGSAFTQSCIFLIICIAHVILTLAAVRLQWGREVKTWVGEKPKLSVIKAVWMQLAHTS